MCASINFSLTDCMCFLIMQQEGREPWQAISYYQMLTDLVGTVRYPMNLVQKSGGGDTDCGRLKSTMGCAETGAATSSA